MITISFVKFYAEAILVFGLVCLALWPEVAWFLAVDSQTGGWW